MFMIESRREKKEDGLRSRLPEARRCAEPEREKRRLAAATLRANGEAYHDRGEPWRKRGGGSPPPR